MIGKKSEQVEVEALDTATAATTEPAQFMAPSGTPEVPAQRAESEAPVEVRKSGLDRKGRVKRTRAATAWASAVALALVTILFVVFVVQNSQQVTIRFLWLDGQLAAATALLIAAVAGALLVGIPAAVRIGQLRHSLKRNA